MDQVTTRAVAAAHDHSEEEDTRPHTDLHMKWSTRAFRALDTEARGFIYKDELLNHMKDSGTGTYTCF